MPSIRSVSLAVLSVLVMTFSVALLPGSAAASLPGGDGGACSSTPNTAPHRYTLTAVYQTGSKSYCYFDGQYEWLEAVKSAAVRGVDQKSGYTSIYVLDSSTGGTEVVGHFCPPGTKKCGVSTYAMSRGNNQGGWSSRESTRDCEQVNFGATREPDAIAAFLSGIGDVAYANSNNYLATLVTTPDKNIVDYTVSQQCGPRGGTL